MKQKPKIFLLDVDGVMTNGQFIYDSKGKKFKVFGPDDHDGLSLLKKYIKIEFVTGDKNGFTRTLNIRAQSGGPLAPIPFALQKTYSYSSFNRGKSRQMSKIIVLEKFRENVK